MRKGEAVRRKWIFHIVLGALALMIADQALAQRDAFEGQVTEYVRLFP
jgi:hypothetical protein